MQTLHLEIPYIRCWNFAETQDEIVHARGTWQGARGPMLGLEFHIEQIADGSRKPTPQKSPRCLFCAKRPP